MQPMEIGSKSIKTQNNNMGQRAKRQFRNNYPQSLLVTVALLLLVLLYEFNPTLHAWMKSTFQWMKSRFW